MLSASLHWLSPVQYPAFATQVRLCSWQVCQSLHCLSELQPVEAQPGIKMSGRMNAARSRKVAVFPIMNIPF